MNKGKKIDTPLTLRIVELWGHLSATARIKILLLFPLMLICSFAELLSITIFPVYLSVLISPDRLSQFPIVENFISLFDNNEEFNKVEFYTILFCSTLVFSALFRVILIRLNILTFVHVNNELSEKIFCLIINKPYKFFLKQNSSEFHALMFKASSLSSNVMEPFLTSIINIVMGLFLIVGLIYVDPSIALGALGFLGCVYGGIVINIRRLLEKNSYILSSLRGPMAKVIQETIGGIRDIIIGSSQNLFSNLYVSKLLAINKADAQNKIYTLSPRIYIEAIGMLVLAVFALVIHSNDEKGFATIVPVLGAVALGLQKLLPLAQQIYSNIILIRSGKHVLKDCLDALRNDNNADKSQLISSDFKGRIQSFEVSKVYFNYSEKSKAVLENISFSANAGDAVGFVGESGSGKSTLLDILMGLLEPNKGVIQANGVIIDKSNILEWYSKIAHVPQSVFLLDDTVANNIAFGINFKEIDKKKLLKVIDIACLTEVLADLPNGIDTKLGERGINLSGGQIQRIGIARALYKATDILILDEATSALDKKTEFKIINNIKNIQKDLIIFVVTHRTSSLKNCNKIFEVKGKKLHKTSFEKIKISEK